VRPFYDEVNSLGIDTMFNDANTVYTYGGITYVGAEGLNVLSQASAGSTETAAFCTFEPTTTPAPGVNAGIFHSVYVIAGSTLEDFYTEGIEGDVIARSGNTLTVRGGLVTANAAQVIQYEDLDSFVLLGPGTLVTADGVSTLGPLNYNSVAVGQHITARGIYSVDATGVVTVDATGSTTNTGSVRLQSTELFGSLTSAASGSLQMNLQTIQYYPASVYDFAGNGVSAAQDPVAASFLVNTGALTLPTIAAGGPVWVDGYVAPFGTAPPDFIAEDVLAAPSVPATLAVTWTGTGTTAPFATLTPTGLTIDLTNAALSGAQLRIGADIIDVTTLTATPNIVPAVAAPDPTSGLPLFSPLFSVGPGAISESATNPITSFNTIAAWETQVVTDLPTTPATQFVARGMYDPVSNTFTASSIDVVL